MEDVVNALETVLMSEVGPGAWVDKGIVCVADIVVEVLAGADLTSALDSTAEEEENEVGAGVLLEDMLEELLSWPTLTTVPSVLDNERVAKVG